MRTAQPHSVPVCLKAGGLALLAGDITVCCAWPLSISQHPASSATRIFYVITRDFLRRRQDSLGDHLGDFLIGFHCIISPVLVDEVSPVVVLSNFREVVGEDEITTVFL